MEKLRLRTTEGSAKMRDAKVDGNMAEILSKPNMYCPYLGNTPYGMSHVQLLTPTPTETLQGQRKQGKDNGMRHEWKRNVSCLSVSVTGNIACP